MYPGALYPKTKQVLEKLKKTGVLDNFYLAGGTSLALQIGHRKSIDLDFFTAKFPKREIILQKIKELKPKIIQEADGTVDLTIDEVKVSFFEYKYPLIGKLVEYEGVSLASITDITCMKLSAISSRGSKKDFIDLYAVLNENTFVNIWKAFEKKFEGVEYQKLHVLKSIIYFEDAESDPDPDYIEKISWSKVKQKLEKEVEKYLKNL